MPQTISQEDIMPHNTLESGKQYLFKTYRQPDLVMVRGQGPYLFDEQGRRYIDLTGGISVTALGHTHQALVAAIAQQAARLGHVSNLFFNDQANALAEALVKRSFAGRVFLCNSGAEANEAAIKAARRYYYDRKQAGQTPRFEIISATHSFHGRTLATVTATGQAKYHEGFAPLPAGFRYVPYGDITALKQAINETTALVMLEPMQGEGGVICPPPGYLKAVRALCDEQGVLLHFDEVQVGMGRTGRWFCWQHDNVLPDSMSLAKALGGGLPLGALVAREEVAAGLVPGTHASTFGGNPICCAAALAFIQVVESENLLARALEVEQRSFTFLKTALRGVKTVKDIRGRGCLLGIEIDKPARALLAPLRERSVLATVAADPVIRLAPPLNIPFDVLEEGLQVLVDVIKESA